MAERMTPEEAERRIQQAHLNGQEVLKAEWRWRLKLLAAAVIKAVGAARRAAR